VQDVRAGMLLCAALFPAAPYSRNLVGSMHDGAKLFLKGGHLIHVNVLGYDVHHVGRAFCSSVVVQQLLLACSTGQSFRMVMNLEEDSSLRFFCMLYSSHLL
jgi:hypothetical protein